MKKNGAIICLIAFALCLSAKAQTKTASFSANCKSLGLQSTSRFDPGYGIITDYFTTYDGSTSSFPLNQSQGDGNILFSGELRPRAGQPGVYEADYAAFSSWYGWVAYGSLAATLPTTDSDGDGLSDVAQLDKAVNTSFSGTVHQDYSSSVSSSISGSLTRIAGQATGNYTITFANDGSTVSGTWGVNAVVGNIEYSRGPVNTLTITAYSSSGVTYNATTTFTVNSTNKITLPQFTVYADGGRTFTVLAGTILNRTGKKYIGNATLYDGLPETSWHDDTKWVFKIVDNNDANGNGIPDLTDAIPVPPYITVQPQSKDAKIGSAVSFSVTASGSAPLHYQWQLNGNNLAGKTNSVLTINSAQNTNAGTYTVLVSNYAGSIQSDPAELSVGLPPTITAQPQSKTLQVGTNVSFVVSSSGSLPVFYQWRFNNTNLSGATDSVLSLQDLQTTNSGNYSVLLTNSYGAITSSLAALTVLIPPTITTQPQNLIAALNSNATFNVSASGSPALRYQWLLNEKKITAATNSAFTITKAQYTNAGSYSVVITNAVGSVTSSPASLAVNGPPGIATQPQSRTIAAGANTFFTLDVAGTAPFTYQWRYNGTNLNGATESTLSLFNVLTNQAGGYSVKVANSVGAVTSVVATLTVLLPPAIISEPKSTNVLFGNSATFFVTAAGAGPLAYQWRWNGTNLPGATSNSFSIPIATSDSSGSYQVVVTNSVGSVLSQPATLNIVLPQNSPDSAPPPSGLISWWSGDNNAADLCGHNHGTLASHVLYNVGKVGQAFYLNGTNAFVQVPNSLSLNPTSQISILAWVNLTGNNVTTRVVDKHTSGGSDGYLLGISTNRLQLKIGTALINGRSTIPLNTFVLIASTFDGSSLKLYNNGVPDTNLAASISIPTNALALRIGADLSGTSTFKGLIDEVMLFNRALSQAEIASIYQLGSTGATKGEGFNAATLTSGNKLRLRFGGRPGILVRLESSSDLANWTPVTYLTNITGTLIFDDPAPTDSNQKFYRIVVP